MAERWTFLSNHGRVLLVVAGDPDIRLSELAKEVGLTERGVQLILGDLQAEGYLSRERIGRRNHYVVDAEQRFRHPHEAEHCIGELIDLFEAPSAVTRVRSRTSAAASAAVAAAAAAAVTVADVAATGVRDLPL